MDTAFGNHHYRNHSADVQDAGAGRSDLPGTGLAANEPPRQPSRADPPTPWDVVAVVGSVVGGSTLPDLLRLV